MGDRRILHAEIIGKTIRLYEVGFPTITRARGCRKEIMSEGIFFLSI